MSTVNEKKLRNLVLPPQVNGKSHGNLELIIEKIRWTTTKKFTEVDIHVKWWGECEGISIRFNSTNSQAKSIRYQINTNYRLLQSYLRQCQAIGVEIFSIKNKDCVGRVCIGIPVKLHNLEDPVGSLRGIYNILSARDFKIGEMSVSFGVEFHASEILSIKTCPEKENSKKVTFKFAEQKKSNKENIFIVGVKKPLSVRPLRPSTLKSKNLKPLNQNAQRLRRVSQDSSISEPMSDIKVSTSSSQTIIDSNDNFMIDTIKIAVNSLELNTIGHSEVRNFINKLYNRKSIVKCAVTSKLIKVHQAEDSNFISYVFDTAPQSKLIQILFFVFHLPKNISDQCSILIIIRWHMKG